MRATKIVLIGAGSASFGLGTIGDIINTPGFKGSTVSLVDINREALETIATLARKMNEAAGAGLTIEHTTDRREALPDAEFVITSFEVEREKLWKLDFEVPLKHGVKQVLGENGGPGGLFHAMRNHHLMLSICHDVWGYCPSALVLNYTNPVPKLCMAVKEYLYVQVVGLCHGIGGQLQNLARVMGVDAENLDVKAAGLNHFTWILDLRFKDTGEDAYPRLEECLKDYDPAFQPLCRKMYDTFHYYPSPGDDHIGEYLPFAHEYCGTKGYDFEAGARYREEMWERIRRVLNGQEPITDLLNRRSGERAIDIIAGILSNSNHLELAVNIPNDGYITNLPKDVIVEVPAIISSYGIQGLRIGDLPNGIASLCNTQAGMQRLIVEAANDGSTDTALQALLADPIVHSAEAAQKILDELLELEADYLPQFREDGPLDRSDLILHFGEHEEPWSE